MTYKLLSISAHDGVAISTDEETWQWLEAEVARLWPDVDTKPVEPEQYSRMVQATVEGQSRARVDYSRDKEISTTLRFLFCENGWEPFAVDAGAYYFRKRV